MAAGLAVLSPSIMSKLRNEHSLISPGVNPAHSPGVHRSPASHSLPGPSSAVPKLSQLNAIRKRQLPGQNSVGKRTVIFMIRQANSMSSRGRSDVQRGHFSAKNACQKLERRFGLHLGAGPATYFLHRGLQRNWLIFQKQEA